MFGVNKCITCVADTCEIHLQGGYTPVLHVVLHVTCNTCVEYNLYYMCETCVLQLFTHVLHEYELHV